MIENPKTITYLKVRLELEPSDQWVTPDSLSIPGQRFDGTVRDNRVEGVFEVEHRRYDGNGAPPFPADLDGRKDLREFLEADEMIQSDDPDIVSLALDVTRCAKDSWEAVRLLGRWVADNIKGAIPGGIHARGTFLQRAGDCGGHSFLMAALCRSLGIPARVVWGCAQVGAAFGQHAWNEVPMGEAGWIPVDTTFHETDFVDSGHIRIGTFQSLSTALNLRCAEVLGFRTAPPQAAR